MSAVAKEFEPAWLWRLRRLWRDPAAWSTTSDIFAILIAASLPWSTSLVAIFAAALLVSMAPFLDARGFLQTLKRPICALPVALFALAVAGTLWSNVPWGERLYAIGPTAKLLMLPVLLYHFERSARGVQVLTAFLVSCALLMVMSWIVAFDPTLALKRGAEYGVPVKNYIDQSQEFALCAVVLAYPVVVSWRAGRAWLAALLVAVSLSFVVNMAFVTVSRTALVTMPIMLAVFALQKSLRFFAEAPVIGHGTGSTRHLFAEAAIGEVGARAQIVANPHNQTLNVAVQWGVIGVVLLYAIWLVHLLLFRGAGLAEWVGLMVVVQNVFTSLFNSHLFDFNEGWMYVLGVGVAGGMVLRARRDDGLKTDP